MKILKSLKNNSFISGGDIQHVPGEEVVRYALGILSTGSMQIVC
jgi:hypothetical protein